MKTSRFYIIAAVLMLLITSCNDDSSMLTIINEDGTCSREMSFHPYPQDVMAPVDQSIENDGLHFGSDWERTWSVMGDSTRHACPMTEAQWDAVLTVNLKSAFNFIHAVSPVMLRQRGGSIINISSIVGVHGNAGQCNYSASKAGMIGLAKSIAAELGPKGVRANVVAPGFILTDMTQKLGPEMLKQWESKIPMRRGGTPAEVAKVCTFLASDLASYVSGQVILVDGGMGM